VQPLKINGQSEGGRKAEEEVLPTRREVRMANGLYEEVESLIELNIRLGQRTVRMQLLILHNIIDVLVLGWDFLSVTIPVG